MHMILNTTDMTIGPLSEGTFLKVEKNLTHMCEPLTKFIELGGERNVA